MPWQKIRLYASLTSLANSCVNVGILVIVFVNLFSVYFSYGFEVLT